MDPELVRQLIEAFSQLGNEAKEAFLWYLFITVIPAKLVELVWAAVAVLTIIVVYRIARYIVTSYTVSERLGRAAGVQTPWCEREIRHGTEILEKHAAEVTKFS